MYNFSKYHKLRICSHTDIDFIDIFIDADVGLYLDPERIACSSGLIAELAHKHLEDFFREFVRLAKNRDRDKLYELLSYGHEPNETHLGMSSKQSRGRGVSPEILMPIIDDMLDLQLFERGVVGRLSDLPLVTPNFGEDRLSDLITNVIRGVLHIFTRSQYDHWCIPYHADQLSYRLPFWDPDEHRWRTMIAPAFLSDGKPTLLVPKTFVGTHLLLTPSQLLQKYALTYGQEEHRAAGSSICPVKTDKLGNSYFNPPSKRAVRAVDLKDRRGKEYIRLQAFHHPEMLPSYHHSIEDRVQKDNIFLSDAQLDAILYRQINIAI